MLIVFGVIIGILLTIVVILVEIYFITRNKGMISILQNQVRPSAKIIQPDVRKDVFEKMAQNQINHDDYGQEIL